MANNMTVKTICGIDLLLESGVRYRASRPMASRGRKLYPITISRLNGNPGGVKVTTLKGFTYDEANDFLTEFNNGTTSFDGRVW